MKSLNVFYEQKKIGQWTIRDDRIMQFVYEQEWIEHKDSFSLSVKMRFTEKKTYEGKDCEAFFENLIPEGDIREEFETLFEIETNDAFQFLSTLGKEVAGALYLTSASEAPPFLTLKDLKKERLINIKKLSLNFERPSGIAKSAKLDGISYSLAGAQNKTVAIFNEKKFFSPHVNIPSTHILKGPHKFLDHPPDGVYNEYLMMSLAQKCQLNVPDVILLVNDFRPILVVKRYDRLVRGLTVKRIHQQDMCQAMGLLSKQKYEKHGGPTFVQVYNLISSITNQLSDQIQLVRWLCFNILIGNNDSHAKNLSLLHIPGRPTQLAPFYDLVATMIYSNQGFTKNFAFSIGGQKDVAKMRAKHLEILAQEIGAPDQYFILRIMEDLIDKMKTHWTETKEKFKTDYPKIITVDRLDKYITKRLNQWSAEIK